MSSTIVFLAFALFFLQGALGELICEELPVEMCSFAISSSGKRCLLEIFEYSDSGNHEFQCKTSDVVATNMLSEYIESEECMSACGIDRNSVGISSDTLMEAQFIHKLCSPQCYNGCPNIVDLYYSLAMAEGIHLPDMCESQRRSSGRRSVIQLISSTAAAYAPFSATDYFGPSSSEAPYVYDFAPAPM